MDKKDYLIRAACPADLDAVTTVEEAGFPPGEAAGRQELERRLSLFRGSYLVADAGRVIGHIDGCVTDRRTITDDLFSNAQAHNPDGAYQAVFGLAVLPEWRRRGVAAALLRAFCANARTAGRKGVILTCKEHLIRYYGTLGFQKLGLSSSVHGGATWYDMEMRF